MLFRSGNGKKIGISHSLCGNFYSQCFPFWRIVAPFYKISSGLPVATFQEYNDGKNDYKNNFVPFAPAHTLALSGAYTLPLDKETDLTFDLQYLGRGKIYWTEANDAAQNFYGLVNASIILSGKYADLKLWGKNLLNQHYQEIGRAHV